MGTMTYEEALAFIHGRTKFKKIPTLDRMNDFCERIGNPQEKLKIIHITGTNGKGSTTAYIRQILIENGFKVGSFTSPFIIKFNDRICINGKMISDDELVQVVEEIKPVVDQMDHDWENRGGGPTEFEIDTAIMFKYFAEQHVDYAVVEAGLGGTYDSTNIIQPLVSVITGVGADHLRYLGPTLQDVARNKAGIIKHDTPIVVADLPNDLFEIITERAKKLSAPVFKINDQIMFKKLKSSEWGEKFNFDFDDFHLKDVKLEMMGDYQISNASLAIAAVKILSQMQKWHLTENDVKRALSIVHWPGRFEKVNESPMVILDGAHNMQAVQELCKLIKEKFSEQKIHIIASILADKQSNEMLQEFLRLPNVELTLAKFDSPRPLMNFDEAKKHFPAIHIAVSWQEALINVVQEMDQSDILLFTGSLYFISEVRHYFKNEEEDKNED